MVSYAQMAGAKRCLVFGCQVHLLHMTVFDQEKAEKELSEFDLVIPTEFVSCLLYTSDAADE